MSVKKIYFVRHGEAEGNAGGFTQTPTTPLTEVGHAQALNVAKRFQHLPIEAVLASHMDRAQDTAKYIAAEKGLPVETTEFFHEVMRPTSIRGAAHDSAEYINFLAAEAENYANPDWRFEDGENFSDILTRVTSGVAMLEERDERHVVVVSHGRLLRFLVSYLLHQKQITPAVEWQTAYSMKASNTGVTLFECDGTHWKLVTWNDTAHFAE
jgi:broad specificity phosphatase PhoE